MTTNIDRAAALRAVLDLHPKSPGQRWVGFPRADRQEHYCMADQQAWPCDTVRALAEVGWPTAAPQIIRTVEELEALDDDAFLMASDGNIYYAIGAKGRLLPSDIPAVVIRDGAGVRAARKVLEEA